METNITPLTKLEQTLHDLAQHKNSARLVWFDYQNEKRLLEQGLISQLTFDQYKERISQKITSLINEPILSPDDGDEKASVFLSYNHADQRLAFRIQEELGKYKVGTRIDVNIVTIGQSIKDFIINQTKENTAVMWLVSEHSVKSYWVNFEASMMDYAEMLLNKHFIPVCRNTFFTDNQFHDDTYEEITKKIHEIEAKIAESHKKGMNSQLWDTSRLELLNVQRQLGTVLSNLKSNRVYPISDEYFSNTIKKIAEQLIVMQQNKKTNKYP
ncbi:toll/interleukin-1 receptor domain-containing protein [Mucilaginibacter rubeus]|uniref:TIR domain-containing protein n=1 Tax=Mucilaginibacter rubeus TaxID=2027860 RepID=A0A5C1HTV8_9SPHI|nr:toll/interleukin-1 receptor domain-containing protein [Mucilaginibacter rubeus]QEM09045.1 TIR domain-containing protein [Mucilaginibacter rubeus]